jgi:2-polyprenyl-3-methyl-5-hydroxy-6-metoxy-1,4-benzoquinol methylase
VELHERALALQCSPLEHRPAARAPTHSPAVSVHVESCCSVGLNLGGALIQLLEYTNVKPIVIVNDGAGMEVDMENRNVDQEKLALSQLTYFLEWGGRAWEEQFVFAMQNFLGFDLYGRTILDIGARSGRMSCFFALLGAKVTGIDIKPGFENTAKAEAERWNVSNRCQFIRNSGDFEVLQDNSYDVVFTKSVLVQVGNLKDTIEAIDRKMKNGAKFIFIENGKGGLIHYLRRLKTHDWDYSSAHYFTNHEIKCISSKFNIVRVRKTFIPPTCLVYGYKYPFEGKR